MLLTDERWAWIEPHIPEEERMKGRNGRPFRPARAVLEGILWVMKTGARWWDLPQKEGFPPGSTCHRRFKQWCEQGVMIKILQALAQFLKEMGIGDLTETYIDGSFVKAKKGVKKLALPRLARDLKSWQLSIVQVFLSPYALSVLHHTRVNLLKARFGPDILKTHLSELWVTKLTIAMLWMLSLQEDMESNLLLPISQIESSRLKMDDLLEDTDDDGELNDSLLGFTPFDVLNEDLNIMLTFI